MEFLIMLLISPVLYAEGSRILMLPGPHKSHIHFFTITARSLKEVGHEVDVLTLESRRSIVERMNIETILYKLSKPNRLIDDPDAFESLVLANSDNIMKLISAMTMAVNDLCDSLFEQVKLLKFLDEKRYDIVLIDGIDYNRCMYALPYTLGIRYITLTVKHDPWQVGLPALPSVEHLPMIGNIITEDSSLFERLKSLFLYVYKYNKSPPSVLDNSAIERYAPTKPKVTYTQLFKMSEMWLVKLETMFLDWPHVYGNHYQFIGGIGLEQAKPLPDELEEFVQSAQEGLIVQSFGTAMQKIPEEMLRKMLKAFSKINYNVIMKHKGHVPNGIPANVRMMEWLPQADLLGHPKTKAFVTHGGTNGQLEALQHAVPVITIPFFADQFYNAERASRKGLGVTLHRHQFTSDELIEAVQQVTSDNVQNTMRMSSEKFNSFPPAEETICFWVEHIIRFGGDHLKPVALNVPIWQFLMLDILAIVMLIVLILYTLVICLLNAACKRCCKFANTKKIKTN